MRKRPTSQGAAPVALVTGAGKRLGKAIARALAEAGFDLIINYHSSRPGATELGREIQNLGRRSLVVKADISRRSDVGRMVQKAVAEFGRIDLLVNNSAVFEKGTLRTTTEKTWNTALEINLKGTFLCCQAVAPLMQKQGGGRINNIASLGGLQAWKEHLPYSVSKAGVIHLTKILARELAPSIQVNAIAPGTIVLPGEETPGVAHLPVERIPLKKYGTSSDITDLVVYLATKASYMTGQIIAVDGGRSISLS